MSAMHHPSDVGAHPDQSRESTRLDLAPGAGPRPDALEVPEEACQVIELFPAAGAPGDRQQGRGSGGAESSAPALGSCSDASLPGQDRRVSRQIRGRARVRAARMRRRAAIRLQLLRLWLGTRAAGQHGMATAEYAIATLGAVAFAGLLVVIMRSDEVRGFLLAIIRQALALP